MQANYWQFGPFLFAVLVLFLVYRRLRRSFGKQPLQPTRMMIRVGLFLVIAVSIAPVTMKSAVFLSATLAGALAGVGLAIFGATRTRFVMYQARLYYVPHTYTGIAVSMLFLGRLAYRLAQAYFTAHASPNPGLSPDSMVSSPLTVGLFFVLIAYYVCYYSWVLYKSKHIKQQELETIPAAAAQ